jgi:hypothetical protein
MNTKLEFLRKRPKHSRTAVARGLPAMDNVADGEDDDAEPVVRDGGDFGAGLISGVSVATRGEAEGHDFWLDGSFLDSLVNSINSDPAGKGLKSRFTHPSLSGDGMGSFLGRLKNASRDGDVVRGDLHLAESAHDTPDGNLAGYVMDLAEEDPAAFGMSIVFDHDEDDEDEYTIANGGNRGTGTKGEGGALCDRDEMMVGFKSQDERNVGNLMHARLKKLRAADVVDSPAANPDGLFLSRNTVAAEASQLASYALGLTESKPVSSQLDIHPDRLRGFLGRFLESNGLTITKKGASMSEPAKQPEVKTEQKTDPTPAPEALSREDALAAARQEAKRFADAFGAQGGAWFAEGKTFEECQVLQLAELRKQNTELAERLKAVGGGQPAPVSFGGADPKAKESDPKFVALKNALGSDSLARFAAGMKFTKAQPAQSPAA